MWCVMPRARMRPGSSCGCSRSVRSAACACASAMTVGKPEGRRAEATARGIAMMERLAGDLGAPLAIGPARPGWVAELTLNL